MVKGSFASQLASFENFLRQKSLMPHLVIQARGEADLNEDDVVEKLNKAKGANFAKAVTKKQVETIARGGGGIFFNSFNALYFMFYRAQACRYKSDPISMRRSWAKR